MLIEVHAKTKKKKEYIKQISQILYEVSVKAEPKEGKANAAIIDALSKYFHVSKSEISITAGLLSKHKILDVPNRLKDFREQPEQSKLF